MNELVQNGDPSSHTGQLRDTVNPKPFVRLLDLRVPRSRYHEGENLIPIISTGGDLGSECQNHISKE